MVSQLKRYFPAVHSLQELEGKEGVENMKNLYPKGKGKIHPSPASPSASSGGAGGQGVDALAVLRLLPAAILALTVALGYEDMEVLAYLITRSMNGPGMGGGGDERQRSRQVGGVHRPIFDCGCFDCYISFWSRWNCSPDRELIHQVIEAFEEHLANSETKAGGCGERGQRRERRASDRSGKRKRGKEEVKKKGAETTEEKVLEIAAVSFTGEEKAPEGDGDERRKAEDEAAAGCERRRGWPDVLGWFKCPWWSLWSPGV